MEILIVSEDKKTARQWSIWVENNFINANVEIVFLKQLPKILSNNIFPDVLFIETNNIADLEQINALDCPSSLAVIAQDASLCLEAFNYNTFTYLIKPISEEDIAQSFAKYDKYFQESKQKNEPDFLEDLQSLMQFVSQKEKQYKKRFMIKIGKSIKSIAIKDIAYFFSHEKINYIQQFNGKKYPTDYTLDEIEAMLNPDFFYRANRQYIVHIDAIEDISPYFKGRVKINLSPTQIADIVISAEKSKKFKHWLNK